MKFKEGMEDTYNNWKAKHQDDIFGLAVFRYVERLAEMLEDKISHTQLSPNETIIKYAEDLSDKADTERITGAMQWFAFGVIHQCWIYGEEFRQWHLRRYNKDLKVD